MGFTKKTKTKTNKKIDSKRQVFYVCVSVGGCNVSLWPEWGQRLFGICLLRKSKLRAACWGDVSFRVWGHHRSFCVGRGVEGVKAVRNGPGGKPSSQNRPSLHSEEIADLNALLWRLDYFGDEDWQYFFFCFFFFSSEEDNIAAYIISFLFLFSCFGGDARLDLNQDPPELESFTRQMRLACWSNFQKLMNVAEATKTGRLLLTVRAWPKKTKSPCHFSFSNVFPTLWVSKKINTKSHKHSSLCTQRP